jgi:hypothetical protein
MGMPEFLPSDSRSEDGSAREKVAPKVAWTAVKQKYEKVGIAMTLQELEQRPTKAQEPKAGPLAAIPSLGFVTRRKRSKGNVAWRETITQHAPEAWPAARLALQARICALD